MEPLEDIKQYNAIELSHIINQYQLERRYVLKISHFLNKSNEGDAYKYDKNLDRLKKDLGEIPYSEFFLKYLYPYKSRFTPRGWQRQDPIENTPKSHKIHAYYHRVLVKTCFSNGDKDRGRQRPDCFVPEHSIMIENVPNKIGPIDKLYIMIKPFDYDFPDIFEVDGMIFEMYELFNPLYLCEKNGLPEPIIINGVKRAPMSNKLYTRLYKTYIVKSQVEKSKLPTSTEVSA